MKRVQPWISAARLRTLPLALSSVFVGSALAFKDGFKNLPLFLFCCLTTILLQILSNFANDYGDFKNGADSSNRVGPKRAVQSGSISESSMRTAILLLVILTLLSGISLLYISFKDSDLEHFLLFFFFGLLAIAAAYFYTAGSLPYGYKGYGDVSVFVFFGLLGVLGSNYLYTKSFTKDLLFPAFAIGFLSVGVLNLNNIRDIETDSLANKKSIPVRIGKQNAIIYHDFLIIAAWSCLFIYNFIHPEINYYYILTLPLFIYNIYKLKKIRNPDPLLKQLAISTLVLAIAFSLSLILF